MYQAQIIAEQVAEDGVAFTPATPTDPVLAEQLREVLASAGDTAVVVHGPESGPAMRNLAQAVLDAQSSGVETVIVRGPLGAAAVSDVHSRAALESAQRAMAAEPDYVIGLQNFLTELDTFSVPWGWLFVVMLLGVTAVVGVTGWAAAKSTPQA